MAISELRMRIYAHENLISHDPEKMVTISNAHSEQINKHEFVTKSTSNKEARESKS